MSITITRAIGVIIIVETTIVFLLLYLLYIITILIEAIPNCSLQNCEKNKNINIFYKADKLSAWFSLIQEHLYCNDLLTFSKE